MHNDNAGGRDRSIGFFEALGMMTAVAMASDYRNWSVSEIEAYLVPALQAGQSKVYFDEDSLPMAFVTWALVNDEYHNALYLHGQNPPPIAGHPAAIFGLSTSLPLSEIRCR